MRVFAAAALTLVPLVMNAQQALRPAEVGRYTQVAPPQAPAQGQPPPQTPSAPQTPPAPSATPLQTRTFTAPVGMILTPVRPERVADFEKLIAYVQAALEKAVDPKTVAQAKGWKFFKATEPGPNGAIVYVFLFDPVVPEAEYSIATILAEAYPDPAQLTEIWKLYTSSVVSGGNLLNLTPSKPVLPPRDDLTPSSKPPAPATTKPPAPGTPPRELPPDADPNRRQ